MPGGEGAPLRSAPAALPRIAIAGLGIESSTFSPARTEAAAFHPVRGPQVLDCYPYLAPGTPLRGAARWVPVLVGKALPGGIVTAEAFASLTGELLAGLAHAVAEGPLDGLHLDLHGAMSVEGLVDAEAVLLSRIRAVIGPDPLVSASLDLHGNVSRALVHGCDLLTCYRTAPHIDVDETRERAVRLLVDRIAAGGRPLKAWVPVPVLLPGEKTSTRIEPARGVYAGIDAVTADPGVLDASIWVGYAWADEPRCHAAVVVTGDDELAVAAGAERLARAFWDAREDFAFVAPTAPLDAAIDRALASPARPFLVSDSGDNPTAGGAGDVTWTLARLLARPEFRAADGPTLIYASIPGPAAIDIAVAAGIGALVTVTVGAAVDDRAEGPVTLTGEVRAIRTGDVHAGTEVVLRTGSIDLIVTARRKPYHLASDFTALGLDPQVTDVVVVKIGYLEPELYAMAADWILALTPGGVDQDLLRLGHRHIQRPMFPYDPDMAEPDLHARWIPPSDVADGDPAR